MIAVRARTVDRRVDVVADDKPDLVPEGVDPRRAVAAEERRANAEQVYYVDDDAVPAGARRLRPTDVPRRTDLPAGHPLRGKRVLAVVPAGWPDCTLDDEGRIVPVDSKTGEVVEAEPVERRRVP